jgi:polar amino acid transport system substrate-binding protein
MPNSKLDAAMPLKRFFLKFDRSNLLAEFNRLWSVGFLLNLALIGLLYWSCFWSDAALAADLHLKQRGTLIVGIKDNLPPLGFRDQQNQLQGFEIDLARQLATDLLGEKAQVVFKPLLNQDRLNALLNGEVDLLIARLTLTDSRARLVEFSRPYYIDGADFITRDPTIQGLRDLRQQTVAVLTGSDTIPTVRSLLPALKLRGVASYAEAKSLLDAGEVNAFAADASVLTGWTQADSSYHLLPDLISAEPLAIAMPKGNQYAELRRGVNQAVERWLHNGWLRQQIRTWGLPTEGFPSFTELPPNAPAERK